MADRYEQMAAKLLDSGSDTEPCTSFISALAVSRQSSTSQKADPEFVLKPIAEGLLHNIAQLVVPNGKGKIDDDVAARAAIRAEADAFAESDIEAMVFEARNRKDDYQRQLELEYQRGRRLTIINENEDSQDC